jgi:hypothetical protein
MPKFTNISTSTVTLVGDAIFAQVQPGDSIEVSADIVSDLQTQPHLWQPADKAAKSTANDADPTA